jgi:hypothetical protein
VQAERGGESLNTLNTLRNFLNNEKGNFQKFQEKFQNINSSSGVQFQNQQNLSSLTNIPPIPHIQNNLGQQNQNYFRTNYPSSNYYKNKNRDNREFSKKFDHIPSKINAENIINSNVNINSSNISNTGNPNHYSTNQLPTTQRFKNYNRKFNINSPHPRYSNQHHQNLINQINHPLNTQHQSAQLVNANITSNPMNNNLFSFNDVKKFSPYQGQTSFSAINKPLNGVNQLPCPVYQSSNYLQTNPSLNYEILTVTIKVNNQFKTLKINKFDDFFEISKNFCKVNNLPDSLIKPIALKINSSIKAINEVFNTSIHDEDLKYLKSLEILWKSQNNEKKEGFFRNNDSITQVDTSDYNDEDLNDISSLSTISRSLNLDEDEELTLTERLNKSF